jgi:protein ImuB
MFWIALLPAAPSAPASSLWLETLAWRALRFSPRVALLEEAVLLEAQGSLRLWGGKRRLLQELEQLGAQDPLTPALSQREREQARLILASAPTALAALALARHAQGPDPPPGRPKADQPPRGAANHAQRGAWGPDPPPGRPKACRHLNTAQLQAGLDALPLHVLSACALHAPLLARLGCRSLGDVRALPRGGLQRRFGAALLDALDRAHGMKPESQPWVTLPETFAQRVELPFHTASADALLFAARRMLQALQAWLAARQSGIRSFELRWLYEHHHRDQAAGAGLTIASAQASRDLAHWLRLLAEHLAHQSLAAPVCELRLEVTQTEALAPGNRSLLPDSGQERSALLQFLERVGARLGATNMLLPQACSDHRAERQALWQNAVQVQAALHPPSPPPSPASGRGRPTPLPCWLLGQALALPVDAKARPLYQGALKLLAGPERIEAGWWDSGQAGPPDSHHGSSDALALRDYFLAQSEHAGLLWIYRERKPAPGAAQWFLHGIYG